jgi:uncharacterized membrane protein YsdA (DUF1294 family)
MMDLFVLISGYLLAVNAITYGLFAFDKHRSRTDGWRIPETRLLMVAFWGGSPAAKLAQHRLRHKTRKEPFRTKLNLIVALHVVAVVMLAFPAVRVVAFDGLRALVGVSAEGAGASGSRGPMPRRFGPGS